MIQFSMYRSEPGNTLNELTHTHARMNRFSFCQRCNCGKEDIESSQDATRIVGGKEAEPNRHPWQAECLLPLNKTFYWIDLRFPWPRGMGSTRVGQASYPSVFSRNISHFRKFYVTNLRKPQAPCINSSPLYKGSKDRLWSDERSKPTYSCPRSAQKGVGGTTSIMNVIIFPTPAKLRRPNN